MEKNYISKIMNTHFYMNFEDGTYGVVINIEDREEAEMIMKRAKAKYELSINEFEKEMRMKQLSKNF